jgi:signal transduction histidine kinase
MTAAVARTRAQWGSMLLGYLLVGVVVVRDLFKYWAEPSLPVVLGLIGAVLVLAATEPLLAPRFSWHRYVYFPAQTGLALTLGLQRPYTDWWGLLYVFLCLQAARTFPQRTLVASGVLWATIATVTTSLTKAWPDGLAVALTIDAAGLFVVSYEVLSAQQERAQKESQDLLQRLQTAHARLQEYAARAEETAAAEERNRLAHGLRDSVNQQLFGITLAASAARLLIDRDRTRVAAQLDQLQELTASALGQMRALIAQLRPRRDE